MDKINIKSDKKRSILDLLLKTDKRRKYELHIASCYFTTEAAESFIKEICENIRLTKITVYIDRKTACVIGKEELTRFCNLYEDLIELRAVDADPLFHTKAYALISRQDEFIHCGSLVIGSANLTGNGIINSSGNIESVLDTQDTEVLDEFISQIETLKLLDIEEIDKFKSSKSFNFKYALIQEGNFIHKWTDNLDQYLSVSFKLNENGKKKISDPAFINAGFDMEAATISKRYFKLDYEPPHLENSENLTRNYGIETYLGYWVPKIALDGFFKNDQFKHFKKELTSEIQNQLYRIENEIKNDLLKLKNEDVIQVTDSDPVQLFKNKVNDLLNNDAKLKRIYSKYQIFDLPYAITQKDDINDLFKQMHMLVESRKKKNTTAKAFLEAISETSLESFRKKILEDWLN